MKFSSELTEWLCRSQVGTSLHAHLADASRDHYCRLCDLPLDAKNEALPCLHWLVAPYCKPERIRPVLADFGVLEAVRYLLIFALSDVRRPSARNFSCEHEDGRLRIRIALRKRIWGFCVDDDGGASFSYLHGRTGFRFELPLALQEGEAQVLRELCCFRAGGLSLWAAPGVGAGPGATAPPARAVHRPVPPPPGAPAFATLFGALA